MQYYTLGFNPNYSEEAPSVEQVEAIEGDLLLEFGAPWCGHCQAAIPAVQSALEDKTSLPHLKIYDGKGKVLGRAFKVKQWPTLILLRDGQEMARSVRPTEISEIEQLLAK